MLRGCRPCVPSGSEDVGTRGARRRTARPPTGRCPVRCRAACHRGRSRARCRGPGPGRGRRRGRNRGRRRARQACGGAGPPRPRTGGIESSSGSSWVTSLRLPPVSRTASGVPCPSVIKWCFELPAPGRPAMGLFGSPFQCPDVGGVDHAAGPVQPRGRVQLGEQNLVRPLPDAGPVPVPQAAPALMPEPKPGSCGRYSRWIPVCRAAAWEGAGDHGPDHGVDADDPLIIDLDATLVTAHSDKERAAPNFKQGFGFHPLGAWVDHGADGTGEPLAIMLRPKNAGSNTAADHQQVLAQALTQLPFQPGISGRPESLDAHRFRRRHARLRAVLPPTREAWRAASTGFTRRCRS